MLSELEHLLPVQNQLADSPIWVPEEQALYWVDIESSRAYRYHPATGNCRTFELSMAITALGRRASGGWVTATKTGLAFWDPQTGHFSFIGDPEANNPHVRCNDGVMDRQGRFLVGTFNEADYNAPDGSLYRLDPDGSIHRLDTGFAVTNGMAFSEDGQTFYLAHMFRSQILAYDYDLSTGLVRNRRTFVSMPRETGLPDGIIVDSAGFVWCAHWDGWKITRYDPAGRVDLEIELPVKNVTSMAFGGENLNELYITTAWLALSDDERQTQPLAGDLFRVKTGITGLAEPQFVS